MWHYSYKVLAATYQNKEQTSHPSRQYSTHSSLWEPDSVIQITLQCTTSQLCFLILFPAKASFVHMHQAKRSVVRFMLHVLGTVKHIATANRTAGEQPSATRTVLFSSTSWQKPETYGHDNNQTPPIQRVASHTQWLSNFRKTNTTNIAKATYKKYFRVDVSMTVKTATTVLLLWHYAVVIYMGTAFWRYTLPPSSSWNVHNHLPGYNKVSQPADYRTKNITLHITCSQPQLRPELWWLSIRVQPLWHLHHIWTRSVTRQDMHQPQMPHFCNAIATKARLTPL